MPGPNDASNSQGTGQTYAELEAEVGDLAEASLLEAEEQEQPEEEEAKAEQSETSASNAEPDDRDPDEEAQQEATEEPKDKPLPKTAQVELPDGAKVTLEELTQGYLKQQDYTRKTQAVAEEKRSVQAERQTVARATQELLQYYEMAKALVRETLPQPPDPQLIDTDVI